MGYYNGGITYTYFFFLSEKMSEAEADYYWTPYIESVLYTEEQILEKTKQLAEQISARYNGKKLVVIGILKGSFMFMADLVRRLSIDHRIEFMALSSYGSKTTSNGSVRIIMDLRTDISDEHVLIVEDIVDSGYTLKFLQDLLKTRSPASLSTCVLLRKPSRQKVEVLNQEDFLGFDIPDEWVVGVYFSSTYSFYFFLYSFDFFLFIFLF